METRGHKILPTLVSTRLKGSKGHAAAGEAV